MTKIIIQEKASYNNYCYISRIVNLPVAHIRLFVYFNVITYLWLFSNVLLKNSITLEILRSGSYPWYMGESEKN